MSRKEEINDLDNFTFEDVVNKSDLKEIEAVLIQSKLFTVAFMLSGKNDQNEQVFMRVSSGSEKTNKAHTAKEIETLIRKRKNLKMTVTVFGSEKDLIIG